MSLTESIVITLLVCYSLGCTIWILSQDDKINKQIMKSDNNINDIEMKNRDLLEENARLKHILNATTIEKVNEERRNDLLRKQARVLRLKAEIKRMEERGD